MNVGHIYHALNGETYFLPLKARLIYAQNYILEHYDYILDVDTLHSVCSQIINDGTTRKKVEECFAKLVLEKYYPDEFYELDFSKERPDLRNDRANLGVEVTSNIPEEDREISSLYNQYRQSGGSGWQVNQLEKLGAKMSSKYCYHPTRGDDYMGVYYSFTRKLKKLQEDAFQKYNRNYLFIRRDVRLIEKDVSILADMVSRENKKTSAKFDSLFIYIDSLNLIKIDLYSRKIHTSKTNSIDVFSLSLYAKLLVLKTVNQLT